jgi:SAM-dependent methyltransferase
MRWRSRSSKAWSDRRDAARLSVRPIGMTIAEVRSDGPSLLQPVARCWVCGGATLQAFHEFRLDYHEYAVQDPELNEYSGQSVRLVRCDACGFAQPEKLPTLPRFFDRMYDQRWSEEWVENEFEADYKDFIFRTILRELDRRVPQRPRRLLDIGAHAGRFMHLAQEAGWEVEGIELNPRTAASASRRTGAPVHHVNARTLVAAGVRFHAITLTDVLEHIPEPVTLLATVARLLEPGGTIAVKVPCGRSQWHKERLLSAVIPSRRISLADNLVHVNHFTPRSLTMALKRAGFRDVLVRTAAPELAPGTSFLRLVSNVVRVAVYAGARLPGAVHTPLGLHLQAYARVGAAAARQDEAVD